MTTIVVANNVMASDSQATLGYTILDEETQKVFNIHGCLIGFAGRYAEGLEFVKWFEKWIESNNAKYMSPNVEIKVPDTLKFEEFSALVMWPDGEVNLYEGGQHMYQVKQPHAIGSGYNFALAALDMGATAQEAVRVAIKRDIYSGGEVRSISLEEIEGEIEEEKEKIKSMSKEELINMILGEEEDNEDGETEEDVPGMVLVETANYDLILVDDEVWLSSEEHHGSINEYSLQSLREIAEEIGMEKKLCSKCNKQTLMKRIYQHLGLED